MNEILTTIIGITGATLTLFAFVMNQTNRWKNSDMIYDVTNAIASTLLFVYALLLGSVPFAILNGIWAVVSIKDVFIGIRTRG